MELGNLLKELRLERGVTQQFVADNIGISRSVLSQYENNQVAPTSIVITKFAKFFNVSTDYLLGLEDDFGQPITVSSEDTYTNEERQLIEEYRKLPADSRKLVLRMVGITPTAQTTKKKA